MADSGEAEDRPTVSVPGDPGGEDLLLPRVPATGAATRSARDQFTTWAARTGLDEGQVDDAALAVYEAMVNVVDHAYDPPGSGALDLHACRKDGFVTVTVTDHGQWKQRGDEQPGLRGRGLLMIERLTHAFEVVPHAWGTVVTMSWLVHAQAV